MFFQKYCSINLNYKINEGAVVGGAKGLFARCCPIWANTDNDKS